MTQTNSDLKRYPDEPWCDYIARQAAANPGPERPHEHVTLHDFAAGVKTFRYRVSLYTEIAGCAFKVEMTGTTILAPDDRRGHMRDGFLCYWLYDDDERWFTLPADMVGKVYDDGQNVWHAKADGMLIELHREGR